MAAFATKTATRIGAIVLAALALVAALFLVTGLPARIPPDPVKQARAAPKPPIIVPKPAAAQLYEIKGELIIDRRLDHGDYAWNEDGVPPGPLLITVDLAAQTLSVFRSGYEIGIAVILYGAGDKPTPLGTFPITQKKRDHVSNLYDAPMPYMMRLTNDGVAIHGSDVAQGLATHGCVGVPTEFAEMLFEQTRLGDRVVITNGVTRHIGERIPLV